MRRTKQDISNDIKDIEEKLAELRNELQEAPEETTRLEKLGFYNPVDEGSYFNVTINGRVQFYSYDTDAYDEACKELGNSFKTKEDAEAAAKRREIMADLWRNSKEFEYHEHNYLIDFSAADQPTLDYHMNFPVLGVIYFSGRKAQEMIDKWGDDLKLLLV